MHKKLSSPSLNSLLRTQSSKQPLKLHENQEGSWLLPQQRAVHEKGLSKHKVVQQLRSWRTNIAINSSNLQATYVFAQTSLLPRHNFKIKRASRQVKTCWQQQRLPSMFRNGRPLFFGYLEDHWETATKKHPFSPTPVHFSNWGLFRGTN